MHRGGGRCGMSVIDVRRFTVGGSNVIAYNITLGSHGGGIEIRKNRRKGGREEGRKGRTEGRKVGHVKQW